MKAPGLYVASRASVPQGGAMWRRLRAQGWPILSSWIDEDGEGQTVDFSDLWMRAEREIAAAVGLVMYVEPDDFPLKGALIEVGMALGMGRPIYVVAPGVLLEARSGRPLGSWLAHPLVGMCASVEEACLRALHPNLHGPELLAARFIAARVRAEQAYHDPSCPPRTCERDGCGVTLFARAQAPAFRPEIASSSREVLAAVQCIGG